MSAAPLSAALSFESPRGTPGPPILIVDDDELSRLLIDSSLEAMQLANPRAQARDGDEAVAYLQPAAAALSPPPALVLLDGQMPGRTGLEVLRWMRQQPLLDKTPVIMLTGSSDVDSLRDAYDSGASSYLVKPVAFEALADVLRGLKTPWMLL